MKYVESSDVSLDDLTRAESAMDFDRLSKSLVSYCLGDHTRDQMEGVIDRYIENQDARVIRASILSLLYIVVSHGEIDLNRFSDRLERIARTSNDRSLNQHMRDIFESIIAHDVKYGDKLTRIASMLRN